MAPLTFKKGDVIGFRFEVHDILGKGGFGEVYLVYDRAANAAFALKTIGSEYLADAESQKAFKKEALLWVNLDEHPFILTARWVDEFSGRLFVEMDHIAPDAWGRVSLADHLAEPHGTLDMDRTLTWAIQFCHGMEHANRHRIECHRDIKPNNILITQDGTLKISDFGLAMGVEAALGQRRGPLVTTSGRGAFGLSLLQSQGKRVCGTPGYIAPEVIRGDGANVRSDIYSFGLILWQMATGSAVPPFHVPDQQDVNEYLGAVYQQQMRGRVPSGGGPLQAVIERCLATEPLKRYDGFGELRSTIEPLLHIRTGRFIELPKVGEKDAKFWNNKGASLYALGRYEEAINCLAKAIEIEPHDAVAWNNKGNPLRSLGRHEESLACYSKALEINSRVAGFWSNKGLTLCALGRYEEALTCYSKSLEIEPQQAGVLSNKGLALSPQGRHQEALTCCRRAVEIDPQFSAAWNNLGIALSGLGRLEEAHACFTKAVEIDPGNIDSWLRKGVTLGEMGHHEEAFACFSKILEIDPRYPDAWINLGLTLRFLGEPEGAINCFEEVLKLNPRDNAAYTGMGAAHCDLGQREEALSWLSKAVERDPRDCDAWMNKGLTLSALGRTKEAAVCFASVVGINPRDTGAWIQKARAEELSGDKRSAASSLRKFLEVARGIPTESKGILIAEDWLRELEQRD